MIIENNPMKIQNLIIKVNSKNRNLKFSIFKNLFPSKNKYSNILLSIIEKKMNNNN